MNTSSKGAAKVVWVLSVMKWCLVVWFLLGGAATVQALWYGTDWPVSLLVIVGAAYVLGAVLAWAFVGWFQHMLGQVAQSNDYTVSVNNDLVGVALADAKAGESADVYLGGRRYVGEDVIGGPPHLPPTERHFRRGDGNLGTGRPTAGEDGTR